MHTPSLKIDTFVLDELVSGTLPPDRYRQVLLALEAQPESWRDCALAFLEQQALTQEFQTLAHTDIDWESTQPLPDAAQLSHLCRETATPNQLSQAERPWVSRRRWCSGLALAAVLLVSFSLGWLGADYRHDTAKPLSHSPSLNPLANQPLANQPARLPTPGEQAPALTMRQVAAPTPATPSAARARDNAHSQSPVHLVSNQLLPMDLGIPPELRDLEKRGRVRIESFDAMFPVNLEDGTSALVPVTQFRVVPVAFSY